MKRNKIFYFVVILSLLFLSGCGLFGSTQTGNPEGLNNAPDNEEYQESGGSSTSGIFDGNPEEDADVAVTEAESSPVTTVVMEALCTAIDDCYVGVDKTACETALDKDINTLYFFGVDTGSYESFSEVQVDIDDGLLDVSQFEVSTCVGAIYSLACDEITEDSPYSSTNASSYSRVYLIIPEEC
jgi:hypothetical protein